MGKKIKSLIAATLLASSFTLIAGNFGLKICKKTKPPRPQCRPGMKQSPRLNRRKTLEPKAYLQIRNKKLTLFENKRSYVIRNKKSIRLIRKNCCAMIHLDTDLHEACKKQWLQFVTKYLLLEPYGDIMKIYFILSHEHLKLLRKWRESIDKNDNLQAEDFHRYRTRISKQMDWLHTLHANYKKVAQSAQNI